MCIRDRFGFVGCRRAPLTPRAQRRGSHVPATASAARSAPTAARTPRKQGCLLGVCHWRTLNARVWPESTLSVHSRLHARVSSLSASNKTCVVGERARSQGNLVGRVAVGLDKDCALVRGWWSGIAHSTVVVAVRAQSAFSPHAQKTLLHFRRAFSWCAGVPCHLCTCAFPFFWRRDCKVF